MRIRGERRLEILTEDLVPELPPLRNVVVACLVHGSLLYRRSYLLGDRQNGAVSSVWPLDGSDAVIPAYVRIRMMGKPN